IDDDDEDWDWGLYIRGNEEYNQKKKEWTTRNAEWLKDRAEKDRLEEEMGPVPAPVPKKKRKSEMDMKREASSFQAAMLNGGAAQKTYKIDYDQIKRITNPDGSLNTDAQLDQSMEEVFEDNLAPPPGGIPHMPPTAKRKRVDAFKPVKPRGGKKSPQAGAKKGAGTLTVAGANAESKGSTKGKGKS
ncbi:unnamed protein product, partial [Discosporangium mesarthrocarpum]